MRRRVLLLSAIALLTGCGQNAGAPAADSAADAGVTVTSGQDLLGEWRTQRLDGADVTSVRDTKGKPLGVTFEQVDGALRWGANDVINYSSGEFTVSAKGEFLSGGAATTLVGSVDNGERHERNAEVVDEATEARLVPGSPRKLLLLTSGKVTAVYTPAT